MESIRADMQALPPGKTLKDKYYMGFRDGGKLIAVMDLIRGYPNKETAYIGFFMMDSDMQSGHFWMKNKFTPAGTVTQTEEYDIVVMQRTLQGL